MNAFSHLSMKHVAAIPTHCSEEVNYAGSIAVKGASILPWLKVSEGEQMGDGRCQVP